MTRTVPALICAVTLMAAPVPAIPDTANERLFEAVASADKDEVRRLLDAGADPNAPNEEGVTVLHRAILSSDEIDVSDVAAVVELLLDAGSVVNAQLPAGDYDLFFDAGDTPLHVAAEWGWVDICRLLLERGANVHTRNANGETALLTSWSREPKIIGLLLDAGADMDARNAQGTTPLHLAATWGNSESVQLLLNAGADVDACNAEGDTALHFAAMRGNSESVQWLLDAGADVDARNAEGDTALHFAAINNDREKVRLLLDAGADVDARDSRGNTPLLEITNFSSWHESRSNSVQLLLDAGADITARNAYGLNPLHIAQFLGQEDLMRLLLGGDADIEAWNASEALKKRFQLYNDCSPMDYGVSIDLSDGESVQGLTEKAISDAVESRLRAARLYDSEEPSYFYVYINLLDSKVGGRHAGWAYNMDVSFNKRVTDEASGIRRWASTWERGNIGLAPDSGTGEAVLSSVRGYMDEFLAEYLRVNEKACE